MASDQNQTFQLPSYHKLTPEILSDLRQALGDGKVITDPDRLAKYSKDSSHLSYTPEAVLLAESAADVQAVLKLGNQHIFPVTPWGSGSGVAGGALTSLGGAALSLAGMNRILEVSQEDMVAVTQPGVIVKDLKDAAREKSLFYPPDPASLAEATIGGTAATNAGGPSCLKYGVTRDYVLGLEAVLPNGELIKTGVRTRKGVVGYDLTHLLVGSEGTLAVITSLTLKIIPHPPALSGLVAVFPGLRQAMAAVSGVMTRGYLPSCLEMMDPTCLNLLADILPFKLPGKNAALLYFECDGPEDRNRLDMEAIKGVCREKQATEFMDAPTQPERDAFWEVRRQMSVRIKDASSFKISLDIAVPIGRVVDLAEFLPELEREFNFTVFAFGHAGDGNIHLNITGTEKSGEALAWQGVEKLLQTVVSMNGTISGEHGVGAAKAKYLPLEIQPESVRLQASLKRQFDPNLILNPGKLFPWVQAE